mgnify:FL=1
METKRVLHFQGRMGKGGAETFMMNAYRNIDREKYQFDFVIYEEYASVQPYHNEIQELGGKIFVVPNPNKHILKYIKAVNKIFDENQVDIVHNEIFFGGGLNLWLASKAGVKQRIAHSHATTDGKGNKFPYNLVRPLFSKLLMTYATDFLACSQEAGVGLFGDKQKFINIPNGINLDAYRYTGISKQDMRLSLGLPSDAFVIGHIGRFETQKNHTFLMQLMQYIVESNPNTYLLAIGTGSLESRIHALAKELGIEKNVRFLGERDDIPQLMSAMDVFVLPSLYEGLPIVAVEAQAANLKLVMSTEVSIHTKLSENVVFVDLQDDMAVWSQAILDSPFGNKPLADLEAYDMNNTAEMLEKIYSNPGE